MLAKKFALGFGIAIILPMVIYYGVSTFSPAPKWNDYYLFYVAVPLGIFAILFGAFSPIQAIGTGLMFGGIFTLTEGYFCYWSELQDWMRFLSLLIAFVVLIYIGYRKLAK